jgi:hypothetical protein
MNTKMIKIDFRIILWKIVVSLLNIRSIENIGSVRILKIGLDMSSFQRIKCSLYPAKPAHAITSIKQSPALKGHFFLVLS